MKKGDKRGQFYLVAAIIISGILISLAYLANYSTKNVSYEAEEIAEELTKIRKEINYASTRRRNYDNPNLER